MPARAAPGGGGGKDELELMVVSWNLLAPTVDDYGVDWEAVRLPSMRRWLAHLGAHCDVLCVQELDLERGVLEEMQQALAPNGFQVLVQKRRDFHVVNAIFFKASTLSLAWSDHRSRALLAGFLLPDGRELVVANVHLKAGDGAGNEAQRISQLSSTLRRMRADASWGQVVCGDFNASLAPGCSLQRALSDAGLSRAPHAGPTFAGDGCLAVFDHIWASNALRFTGALDSCLEASRLAQGAKLPSAEVPSDHLPVSAAYCLPRSGGGAPLPAVEPPAVVGEDLRREWLEILRIAPVPALAGAGVAKPRNREREQRRLEKDFLRMIDAAEAAELKAWQAAAGKAAGTVLQAAVGRAVQKLWALTERAPCGGG